MNVAVIVPVLTWGDARQRALNLTMRHLADWPAFTVGGANSAAARNCGARLTRSDVLLFNDADTVTPHDQMGDAIRCASDGPGIVFAFDCYYRLDKDTTEALDAPGDAFEAPVCDEFAAPPSHGCLAMSRYTFEALGGYDEELYGFEDVDLNDRSQALWPIRRVPGEAVHLWHPRLGDPGDSAWDEHFADARRLYDAKVKSRA